MTPYNFFSLASSLPSYFCSTVVWHLFILPRLSPFLFSIIHHVYPLFPLSVLHSCVQTKMDLQEIKQEYGSFNFWIYRQGVLLLVWSLVQLCMILCICSNLVPFVFQLFYVSIRTSMGRLLSTIIMVTCKHRFPGTNYRSNVVWIYDWYMDKSGVNRAECGDQLGKRSKMIGEEEERNWPDFIRTFCSN